MRQIKPSETIKPIKEINKLSNQNTQSKKPMEEEILKYPKNQTEQICAKVRGSITPNESIATIFKQL